MPRFCPKSTRYDLSSLRVKEGMRARLTVLTALLMAIAACGGTSDPGVLRLATTTSTADSGLLGAILPEFESELDARVDVVAVGTGQAIALGEAGDADVILVHARSREDAFVAAGHGLERIDVMFNDFVVVGPESDPAEISGEPTAAQAFRRIAATGSTFASRGDDSGTHSKELAVWEVAGISPEADLGWYKSLGQGMGSTLNYASETGAYTLTDRGTFLSQSGNLPGLVILVGGSSIADNEDPTLLNPYGVIPINPDKGNINDDLAERFVEWLTAIDTQQMIQQFGVDSFGQPLFYPNSDAWHDQ
jgi:tungstate transport system substrate-binding protein